MQRNKHEVYPEDIVQKEYPTETFAVLELIVSSQLCRDLISFSSLFKWMCKYMTRTTFLTVHTMLKNFNYLSLTTIPRV